MTFSFHYILMLILQDVCCVPFFFFRAGLKGQNQHNIDKNIFLISMFIPHTADICNITCKWTFLINVVNYVIINFDKTIIFSYCSSNTTVN